jgi:O-antigen/teichoic acid export membrane protein
MTGMRLLLNAAWNYSSTLIGGLVGLALVPYVTRHMPAEEYGLALFALATAEIFLLFDFGLFGLLPRGFLAERANPDGQPSRLVGTAVLASAGLGALAGGAAIAVGFGVARFAPIEQTTAAQLGPTILAVGGMIVLAFPGEALTRVYEAENRFTLLAWLNGSLGIARAALTILFLRAGAGASGIVGAVAIVAGLRFVALASPFLLRRVGLWPVPLRWDWPRLRATWRSGGWAALDNIAHHVSFSIDALVLFALHSSRSVSLFGVANKLPLHAGIAIDRGVAVILPSMAHHHVVGDPRETVRLFVTALRFTLLATLPVFMVGVAVATPLLVLWAGQDYGAAAPTLRWLLGRMAGAAIAVPCITVLYAVNAVAADAKIAVAEASLNLALTIALVPAFGAAGAASATAVTHVGTTVCWLLPTACVRAGIPLVRVIVESTRGLLLPVVVCLAVLGVMVAFTDPRNHVHRVLGGGVAAAAYAAAAWSRRRVLWPSVAGAS